MCVDCIQYISLGHMLTHHEFLCREISRTKPVLRTVPWTTAMSSCYMMGTQMRRATATVMMTGVLRRWVLA